jgi:hypothetical protein
MGSGWFETVAVAQRRAKKVLPKSVYWSIVAGSEQGATLKDNVAAFGELGFTPHVGGLPAKRDLAGQPRRADGASRPRARARATASPRRCVPSFA